MGCSRSGRMDHAMKQASGLALFLLSLALQAAFSQGGGRGGVNALDSVPNLSAEQRAALARVNEELSSQARAVTAARSALAQAAFAEPRNPAAIPIMAGAVREAELAFAMAYSDALARIQKSPARLSPDQLTAWTRVAGTAQTEGRGGRGAALYLTQRQAAALAQMSSDLAPLTQAAAAAPAAPLTAPPAQVAA